MTGLAPELRVGYLRRVCRSHQSHLRRSICPTLHGDQPMSTSAAATVAATRSIIYLGIDVYKESITIAVLPDVRHRRESTAYRTI